MRTRAAHATLIALTLLAGLTACASDQDAPLRGTEGPKQSLAGVTPGAKDTSVPPFGKGTRPVDGGPGKGNGLTVTGVRTASHADFDRVVFDLTGKGTPGWYVRYVKRPVNDGSGTRVRLKGRSFLQVAIHGVGYPTDTGATGTDASTRVSGAGTTGIAEIAPGAVFEGSQLAYVGLTGTKRPFRVFALKKPARLVVDVRHP